MQSSQVKTSCRCSTSDCAKCLSGNCKLANCVIHTIVAKENYRKNRIKNVYPDRGIMRHALSQKKVVEGIPLELDLDIKIYNLIEKISEVQTQIAIYKEDLRQIFEQYEFHEPEGLLKELKIEIEIWNYNQKEDFRGFDKTKFFPVNRRGKIDVKLIDDAIEYLVGLKAELQSHD